MSMSRKDYTLIAATLKARRELILHDRAVEVGIRGIAVTAIDHIARDLSINLAVENSAFDRQRFLTACGVSS